MKTLAKIFSSRQFWTIVVMVLVNGVASIQDIIPASALIYVNGVLGLVAYYFRVSPRQEFS